MSDDLDDLDPAPGGAMAPLDRQAPPDYRDASRAQIMPRLDDPPAASSPSVAVPLPTGAEADEPGAEPGAEPVAVVDSGPTGVADPFSEDSATPVDPSDAMTGAVSAFVRSAVRTEPSPEDATTDPWANLARARTSAFVGAPALALPLPSDDVGSRTATHEAEHRGRRRGVWAAIASGVVAAAAVVVYIAMDHRAPGAHSAGGAQGAADRAGLSDEDIARGMQPVSGKLRACFAGAHGAAVLRFAVAPSGRVVTAVVIGALAGTPGAGCATSAVRTAAFAPWSGAPQIVEYRVPLD